MALSDEVFAKLDSLIMSENNPPAAIDSSADMPVDTTNVDTTGIDPIKSLHSQFYAGKDSIAKVFKNSRVELNKSLDSLNNRIAGFNKIKDAGFNVDAPLKEQEKAKSEALKALEYQWSMEHWGSGRERWTPDHTQHMANVIDHIASLITAFEPYKGKE